MGFSDQSFGRGGHRPLAEINVTPLVDVMLVLLIVFMITAPMLATGLRVDLPQAKSAQPINPKEPIVVSVTRDGRYAVGQDEMELPALVESLVAKTSGDPARVIQIRSDKDAAYGAIIGVIDALASNGMVHIALISDAKSRASVDQKKAPVAAPSPAATQTK